MPTDKALPAHLPARQVGGYDVPDEVSPEIVNLTSETAPTFILRQPDSEDSPLSLVPQSHRKVDEAVKILLTANSGEERLAMKSEFFESAPVGS